MCVAVAVCLDIKRSAKSVSHKINSLMHEVFWSFEAQYFPFLHFWKKKIVFDIFGGIENVLCDGYQIPMEMNAYRQLLYLEYGFE